MFELLLPATLGGIAVALAAGPMGSFVIWRRLAFFGDTLSHGALLGATIALVFGTSLYWPVVIVCLFMAVVLTLLQQQQLLSDDTLLGIIAHTTLATGIVAISLQQGVYVDLFGYLFGDLLSVGWDQLYLLWGGSAVILMVLISQWRRILAIAVNEELAQVEGVPVLLVRLLVMLLLALLVAGAIRTVGVLLITALLVIPAATARHFANTAESMCLIASLFGVIAVVGGICASWLANTPVGPTIVLIAAAVFFLSLLAHQLRWVGNYSS